MTDTSTEAESDGEEPEWVTHDIKEWVEADRGQAVVETEITSGQMHANNHRLGVTLHYGPEAGVAISVGSLIEETPQIYGYASLSPEEAYRMGSALMKYGAKHAADQQQAKATDGGER